MNQSSGDWRGQGAPPQQNDGQPGRPQFAAYGQNGPSQTSHVLHPAPSNYHHQAPPPPPQSQSQQQQQPPPQQQQQQQQVSSGGHSLSIADLTQGPPQQQHQYNTQPPPSNQSHSLGSTSNPLSHHSPSYLNRDRDVREMRREQELREREMHDREQRAHEERMMRERDARDAREMHDREQRAHEERMMRERDARERERMDRLRAEQPPQQAPVQSHAGSIPIHQPVANKVQNSIHGPNGLLANGGAGPQPNGGPVNPPSNVFGMPPQHEQRPPQYAPQQAAPPQQHTQPFIGGPSPMAHQAQLAHGQQPILNDALSYLDQVKVRFSDQPDVYNKFLDIMKDFKSQAIDTPGVIQRVSELFNGHPALIQGFNTFLPPGYRIECGTEENPDTIRVTTPSGTMTQSLHLRGARPFEGGAQPMFQSGLSRQDGPDPGPRWANQMSPAAKNGRLPGYEQVHDNEAQHQEQRGLSLAQNNIPSAVAVPGRQAQAASPGPVQGFPAQTGAYNTGADLKRGGPVEFNHAISYVNKIKNRFAQQPEIYKQFLEILQTYQREQKPIQDVYSQVTQLFITAPDLLEDFKQFLPETAAHAKAQASQRAQANEESVSNLRGDPGYGAGQVVGAQTPRATSKMPPIGQFDPPSTSKDNKKRRSGPGPNSTQTQSAVDANLAAGKSSAVPATNGNKRQKISNQRPVQPEAVPVSPTLIPQLPEPLPPMPSASTTQEELGFFDRVKKQVANRASYSEFLKLINLYTQDLIDKYTLADRVSAFIGSNQELMSYFKTFVGVEDHEEIVEARARPDTGRINLAHCRSFGPSYRHLPLRDQQKPCKGRDGMCYEVLNDVWASHPTWASEDSGFVAHRKNQYEEALHRIEEERHDYDFHIESCQRTVQLMEPLVQQFAVMTEADLKKFTLDKTLGGASEAIPKRIILKIYGREVGNRVLEDMYTKPVAVLPIVLNRLKQKLEEWKQVQREWEKVWRDQINKQFWKSLDHQGINAKNLDKKNFQQKTLTSEIQAKYEERKRDRSAGIWTKKHQLEYDFKDLNILIDTTRLIFTGLESEKSVYNSSEQGRIRSWLTDFVTKFFGLDKDKFVEQVEAALQPPNSGEIEDEQEGPTSVINGKRSHKTSDWLRRAALERRNGKEDSVASASGTSTPAPGPSEMDVDDEQPVAEALTEQSERRWINVKEADKSARQMAMDDPYEHTTYNLYANANIYCFFRLLEAMCSRLLAVKDNEASVVEDINRWKGEHGRRKPALSLAMIDKQPDDFFPDTTGRRTYYHQILDMCDDVLLGRAELSHLEETLRRYYIKNGWQLYTIDKLVSAILRFVMNILGGDSKDKSVDITNLFFRDREKPDTTRKQEIQYRKQVEKLSKDGEVYRISYAPKEQFCTIRLFPSDDATFDSDQLTENARWQYYVASYTMTDATEGVDQTRMRPPYLRRSIAPQNIDIDAAYEEVYGRLGHEDDQSAFISPESYKLYLGGTFAFERHGLKPRKNYNPGHIEESEPFKEKFIQNVAWMKDQQADDVEARKAAWDKGVKEGLHGFEDGLGR